MREKKSCRGGVCIAAGLVLILAALGLAAYNIWDDNRAAASASEGYAQLLQRIPTGDQVWQGPDSGGAQAAEDSGRAASIEQPRYPDYVLDPHMQMPTIEVDGNDYIGTLQIPALELSLPVLSQWSDENLKIAPCRYSGSAYLDDLVIAAHNYSRHFGKLKDLSAGDAVIFTDADGNEFCYVVAELEQLQPAAVEQLYAGEWALSLLTCTVGGQYRVVARCSTLEEAAK